MTAPPCAEDPDAWFPPGPTAPSYPARQVCLTQCPRRADCLSEVLSLRPQPPGIWAGLDEDQRRSLAPRWRARTNTAPRPLALGPPPARR